MEENMALDGEARYLEFQGQLPLQSKGIKVPIEVYTVKYI